MKLIVATCIKEYQAEVGKIFKKANISVFSSTNIVGLKTNESGDILDSWFAKGEEEFDSVLLFSFTAIENAELAMRLIQEFNNKNKDFPVRAFLLPVEKSI